jgi:UDP-N-acetyl-2-amino-2-deoxyglucuronate dehydrogenase
VAVVCPDALGSRSLTAARKNGGIAGATQQGGTFLQAVGTALIGIGKVGETHAQALATLAESSFVGVYHPDRARAQAFASRYAVRGFCNLDEMLHDPRVQMVTICTPHPSHPELVLACARAGKHALVEKPMAVDLRGCDAMIEAADRTGITLGVISQRRFYEPALRMKQAIDDGKIGPPVLGTVTVMGWRDEAYYQSDPWRGKWTTEGGGVMLTQTSHQIDLLQWYMGPIDELFGYWGNLNHPYVEVEDTAIAVMRFRSGALGTLLLSNSQRPGLWGKIHVHGQNGASVGVRTDGGSSFVSGMTSAVEPPINDVWTVPGEEQLLAGWQAEDTARCQSVDVMTYYHRLQIQDFLCAIMEGRSPAVTGREGRKHVEIAIAVYRSQRDRRPISFPLDAVAGSESFDGRLAPH